MVKKHKEELSEAKTFFLYGVLGGFSVLFGIIFMIIGLFKGSLFLIGLILSIFGFYLRFKYKIRSQVIHLRKG